MRVGLLLRIVVKEWGTPARYILNNMVQYFSYFLVWQHTGPW